MKDEENGVFSRYGDAGPAGNRRNAAAPREARDGDAAKTKWRADRQPPVMSRKERKTAEKQQKQQQKQQQKRERELEKLRKKQPETEPPAEERADQLKDPYSGLTREERRSRIKREKQLEKLRAKKEKRQEKEQAKEQERQQKDENATDKQLAKEDKKAAKRQAKEDKREEKRARKRAARLAPVALSAGRCFAMIVFGLLPVLGVVFCLVWSYGARRHDQQRNLAKAMLCVHAAALVVLLLALCVWVCWLSGVFTWLYGYFWG